MKRLARIPIALFACAVASSVVAFTGCDSDESVPGGGAASSTGGQTAGGTGPGGASGGGGSGGNASGSSAAGRIRYIHRTEPVDDPYLSDPASWADWYNEHHHRMIVFSPFFDDKLSWFPNGWDYFDLYAIYAGSQLLADHPEWVLRDGNGNMLFIPWGCSGGTCPQYAGDISSPEFRSWWITEAKDLIETRGYLGLWVDDVNLDFRVGDGDGQFVAPIDPNTQLEMTEDDWRRYMAEFTELIRTELPTAEICHNSIWYAGGSERHQNQFVQRQIAAADYLNIEHGFVDDGVTGGSGSFSLSAMFDYIDYVHQASRAVLIEGGTNDPAMLEYSLANYFLIATDADGLGHHDDANPENWWSGHDVELGAPLGPHDVWDGLRRREFTGGLVLVNEPDAPEQTATLPETFITIDGSSVNSVTLGPKAGVVLRR